MSDNEEIANANAPGVPGGGNNRPPDPVDANVVINNPSRRGSRSTSRGRRRRASPSPTGVRRNPSCTARSRLSSRASTPASSVARDAGFATPTGTEEPTKGVGRFVRPLAGAGRIILKKDRFSDTIQDAAYRALKEVAGEDFLSQAMREERDKLEEEEEKARNTDIKDEFHLDADMETRPDASLERMDQAYNSLRKMHIGFKFDGKGMKLERFLRTFVNEVNRNRLSEAQSLALLLPYMEGSYYHYVKESSNMLGLRETVRDMGNNKCLKITMEDLAGDIAKWKLDKNKHVGEQLYDLKMLLLCANPLSTRQDIESKLRHHVTQQLPAGNDMLSRELRYGRTHKGNAMSFERFVREVESILSESGKGRASAKRVEMQETRERDGSVVRDQTTTALVSVLESLQRELHETRFNRQQLEEMTKEAAAQAIREIKAAQVQYVAPREEKQVNCPPGFSGIARAQTPPPQASTGAVKKPFYQPPFVRNGDGQRGFRQQDQRNTYPGQGTANLKFINKGDPEYHVAARLIPKRDLGGGDLPPDGANPWPKLHYFVSGGRMAAKDGANLRRIPGYMDPFVLDQKANRYMLTNRINGWFSRRCGTCGIEGHRSSSRSCPMYEQADSWDPCQVCGLGFHERCIYDPAFLASLPEN